MGKLDAIINKISILAEADIESWTRKQSIKHISVLRNC